MRLMYLSWVGVASNDLKSGVNHSHPTKLVDNGSHSNQTGLQPMPDRFLCIERSIIHATMREWLTQTEANVRDRLQKDYQQFEATMAEENSIHTKSCLFLRSLTYL